jgi:tetratricopeptide (TPR) repeat protein
MSRPPPEDPEFEISFFESVLRRSPGYADVIEILGGLYTKNGRIADGLRMDRRMVRLQPENATAHYNLACSLALSGRKADALRALRQAVDLGYADLAWMMKDADLKELREHPAFTRLLTQMAGKELKSGKSRRKA